MKELRRQLKIQIHQVDQMKDELALKEAIISQANLNKVNAEKETENLKVGQL